MLCEDYVRIIIAIFVTCDHVYSEYEVIFYNFRGRRLVANGFRSLTIYLYGVALDLAPLELQ